MRSSGCSTTGGADTSSAFPRGDFVELDLDEADDTPGAGRPASRGENTAHIVVGLLTNYTQVVPEGMTRVALLSDPTQGLGNLAEPECRVINAALALAAERRLPVEWYAVSSGALIAMDSGTENMDWIALTLRRHHRVHPGRWRDQHHRHRHQRRRPALLERRGDDAHAHQGHPCHDARQRHGAHRQAGARLLRRRVGRGQLRHRRLRPGDGAQRSGPVLGAELPDACALLLRHYDYTYVVPGERFPRRRPTVDPADRDVRTAPHDDGARHDRSPG